MRSWACNEAVGWRHPPGAADAPSPYSRAAQPLDNGAYLPLLRPFGPKNATSDSTVQASPQNPPHASPSSDASYRWQFFRAGGVDQVIIRSGQDIAHLPELDQKLWVALACPTRGIEFDSRTLDLIDTDHDGRIRPPELLAACAWACSLLADPEELARPGDALPLSALAAGSAEADALRAQAQRILALAGRPEADAITLAEVLARSGQLGAQRFNGDGVVSPDAAQDDALAAQTLRWIMQTQGSAPAVDDQPDGVNRQLAEAFFADVAKLRAWHDAALQATAGLPLGEGTLAATQAVNRVAAKVEDFFARSRLAAYDLKAAAALNPTQESYAALAAGHDLALSSDAIAALPIAPVSAVGPHGVLPLAEGVNPAWADALAALRARAVAPLLGAGVDTLTEAQWQQVKAAVAPCQQWLASKPATPLGPIEGEPLFDAVLRGDAEPRVLALIDQDEAEKAHNDATLALEKLLRFKRDLMELLNNFVSFSAFYQRRGAIFQAGTLYLDARSCDLTVQVADAGAHAKLAGLAKTYLAYCECTRRGDKGAAQKMTVVAAITAGDVDYLFTGRNGVFYDRQGRDWDATITKIIENPTSIAQAFFSPYKKFLRMIEEQVAKRAAASDSRVEKSLGAQAGTLAAVPLTGTAAAAAAAAKPAPGDTGMRRTDVGTVAAIGVALGSISAVLVGIFGKFIELGPWIPLALIGIMFAISGPSVLIAWLKLRQRSLGPLLDASGWAINGRMRINTRLGGSLSQTAHVPPNARRMLDDPFAEPRGRLWLGLAAVAALAAAGFAAWRTMGF